MILFQGNFLMHWTQYTMEAVEAKVEGGDVNNSVPNGQVNEEVHDIFNI